MPDTNATQAPYVPKPKPKRSTINLAMAGIFAFIFLGTALIFSSITDPPAAAPTPAPTSLPPAMILPAGHYPPGSADAGAWNQDEIPADLLDAALAFAALPAPDPGQDSAARLQIPAIDVDAVILQGDAWEQLRQGIGQHIGSAEPGQAGNIVLAGFNDVYGGVFRDLEQLAPGDALILTTSAGQQYTYRVSATQVVAPTDTWVMEPTRSATLTLITAHPYGVDDRRMVVSAALDGP